MLTKGIGVETAAHSGPSSAVKRILTTWCALVLKLKLLLVVEPSVREVRARSGVIFWDEIRR